MAPLQLVFKVTKDRGESNVELDHMSVDAAAAFIVIVEALVEMVKLSSEPQNGWISIRRGSAEAAVGGAVAEEIVNDFENVVNNRCPSKQLVSQWRSIQKVIKANGLQYEAYVERGRQRESIYGAIRAAKTFRTKSETRRFTTNLEFFTGHLIAAGGKKPNIHVEKANNPDERVTIACTHDSALKANKFLYNTIRLSTFVKDTGGEKSYVLCDSYSSIESFEFFKGFTETFGNMDEVSALKRLHFTIRDSLTEQRFGRVRQIMRLFNSTSADPNILKTILIVTRPFENTEGIKEVRAELKAKFDDMMKKIKKSRNQ